jgi:hypothetical protein
MSSCADDIPVPMVCLLAWSERALSRLAIGIENGPSAPCMFPVVRVLDHGKFLPCTTQFLKQYIDAQNLACDAGSIFVFPIIASERTLYK